MARVEDLPSEEEEEPEVIIEDDATEQDEIDNESEASDDLSETDEADRIMEEKARELEQQIDNDPYNYDLHVQLIEQFDKLSDLERMRMAFESLHSLMPLRPEQWLMWTQSEASVAQSQQERENVHDLYRSATNEVYSIPLYLQWMMFAMSAPIEEARATLGVITRRAGYDPAASSNIWKGVTMLEKMQLREMSECDSDAFSEQVVRTARCLSEQLTRPLLHTETAMQELRELVEAHGQRLRQGFLDTIMKQHDEVKEIRQQVAAFEDRLLEAELSEKIEIYKEYIGAVRRLYKDDKDADSPFNVLEMCACLYDRATYECQSCDSADVLFDEYARLACRLSYEAGLRILQVCVARRPLVPTYWTMTMQHLERTKRPFEEITAVLERSLQNSKLTHRDSECLWLGYMECLRRHTNLDLPEQRDKLRNNFSHALSTLQMMYPEADPPCELMLFWARLEYNRLDAPARGKEIFEQLFENAHIKSQSSLWLTLLQLEQARRPRPPDKKLRELHRRAVRFTEDYPPAVCECWVAFERDYGTLDTMLQCKEACEEVTEKWRQSYQTQKESKQNAKKAKSKKQQNSEGRQKAKTGEQKDGQTDARGKKRSAERDPRQEAKKKKDEGEVKQNGVKRMHWEPSSVTVETKRQRLDSEGDKSTTSTSSHEPPPEKQAATLFVSNLDNKFDETSLRSILSEWGSIAALRIVRGVKAFGGSICYCEYLSPDSVEEALKHDRTPLDGRPMFLSRYQNKGKGKEQRFKYATSQERNKLFVKNLPFSHCTEARLREVFDKYGPLRDVRAVTHKTGRPKGLAYIEYEDEKSAAAALQATDNLLLEERNIQVAYSAPPPKPDSKTSLGQDRRDGSKEHRRTQLSAFVPRVLQKPTAGPSTSTDKKPMSNSDFRNLLLNKK